MKIKISYNQNCGRFVLDPHFNLNGLVRNMPNRRWDTKKKTWSAPNIRANVTYLQQLNVTHPGAIEWVGDAESVLNDALEAAKSTVTKMSSGNKFPSWYPFKTKPRAKQLEALNKVYGAKAFALFMDMRTGKTKVIIDMIAAMTMEGKADRVLIVCPLSIRKNWGHEVSVHSPIPVDMYFLDTSKPKKFDEWVGTPHDSKWLCVGVESLGSGSAVDYCKRFLCSGVRTVMIIDESSKIKNHSATRAKNCVALRNMAETRGIMTGTPIAHGPMDLFMQFEFLDSNIIGMGDYYSFRNRYAVMGGFDNKQIIGYDNLPELMEIIEPFVFQVRKGEVFPDAPDKIYIRREVAMTAEQKKIFNQIKKDKLIQSGDKSLTIQNALEKMLRLQEVSGGIVSYSVENPVKGGPKYYRELITGGNPKLTELIACTEEYDGPTIVWCAYKEEILMVTNALRKEYGDDQVVELHGGVDEVDRDINVNVKFQGGKAKYLVGNAATGGMGLTMSTAEIEIYFSNTFNFIDREQSEERAFGPNKKNGTVVIDLIMDGSIDKHILEALTQKKDVSTYVRDSIDSIKAELDN